MSQKKILAEAVRCALLVGTTGIVFSGGAFAQDAAPAKEGVTTLDSVSVTGTRIKRVDMETASPVFEIDRAAIDKSGALTVGNFLQSIPSIAGAATNPQVNNGGGDGSATVSLRGLGDQRTLVLVNGRRMVTKDVNAIPMSMVERVEILKDGASVVYGSDAVGGVVNFILKTNFTGIETTFNYGISDHGDGMRQGGNSTIGWSEDRGHVVLSLNYNNQNEVSAADRDYSKFALTLYSGVVTIGGSSRTTTGRYAVSESVVGLDCNADGDFADNAALTRIDGTAGTEIADFRCFKNSTDLFNYQAVGNLQLTPQERAGMFVSGEYQITDAVTGYVDMFVNKTRSASQIAPLPFDGRPGNDNIVLSADSYYNPFGVDITDGRLRLSRIGNRRYDFSTDTSQINAGLKGNFGDSSWSWDTGFGYGKINQAATTTGYLVSSALVGGLGASFLDPEDGLVKCGTLGNPIAGCTPLDFFGAPPDPTTAEGQAALAAFAAVSPNTTNRSSRWFRSFSANFSGDLMDVAAGTIQGAFGVDYRKERLDFNPDFLARIELVNYTCQISSEACTSPTSGETEVKELYGEILWPLLSDVKWAKSLNMTIGTRFSDHSITGTALNSKIGFEWRTNDELLIRGTYAEVFRSPTINDFFGGALNNSDSFGDPCNKITVANPACENVPLDGTFKQTDTQLSAIKSGNPNLKPEQGSVTTIGFVYDPSWADGLSTTVDFWQAKLSDTITSFGTQTILDVCAGTGNALACSLFSRDENGEIIRLFDARANVGNTSTSGVDIGVKYRFDTDWGKFRASFDTTYVDEYTKDIIFDGIYVGTQQLEGTFLSSSKGGDGNYSQWRALTALNWSRGDWDAQWTARYVDGFQVGGSGTTSVDSCADAAAPKGSPLCVFTRGAHTYHNLQVGYAMPSWHLQIRAGVDNVFDKQPPILYQNNTLNGNTDETTFDTVGRYYWTNVTITF